MKIISLCLFAIIAFGVPAFAAHHDEYPVATPPLSPGIFPCSNCHAGMEVNAKRRELKDEHTNIKLHHAENDRWCLDCHNPANRDKLKLANGDTIQFTESYLLCGQCHGNIYRDWKVGIHGKRVGYFKGGKRVYFLCVNCHNPHDPKFKPLKPEPPPTRPERTYGR
jgi:formate-dependent nitrite reductase cytochrome c552 subunit